MNTKLAALLASAIVALVPMVASAQFVTQCATANEGDACISGDIVSTCVMGDGGLYCDVSRGTKVTVDSSGQPVFGGTQTVTGQANSPTQTIVGQPNAPTGTVYLKNPLGEGTDLDSLLVKILDLVIRLGTIVIIFMIIFVGFKFVVAQGVPGKIEEAKKMLLWTLIGALILLGAKAIALGIQATVTALSTGN